MTRAQRRRQKAALAGLKAYWAARELSQSPHAIQMRLWRQKRKEAVAAALLAHKGELVRNRVRRFRARRAAKWAEFLINQWFSPSLPDQEALGIIIQTHVRSQLEAFNDLAYLRSQCEHNALNLNRFVVSMPGKDGVAAAVEARAVLEQLQHGELAGLAESAVKASTIGSLKELPGLGGDDSWSENLRRKARDSAQSQWREGSSVYKAVCQMVAKLRRK
jgi:hypothetical protein